MSTKNNNNKCKDCCACIFIAMTISICISIASCIFYHIFTSIVAISSICNQEIRNICNKNYVNDTHNYTYNGNDSSQIWIYVLLSTILIIVKISILIYKSNHNINLITMNLYGVIITFLCYWGWDQLFNSGTCLQYNYKNTKLMSSAYIHFYVQLVICIVILFIDFLNISKLSSFLKDKCITKSVINMQTMVDEKHSKKVNNNRIACVV